MITGIPGYACPSFHSLRCPCGVRYVVLVSADDKEQVARREAERINADFIDTRRLLALACYCGASIDVSGEVIESVQ